MDVPDKYLDLVFSVPPNEMRWITQSEFDSDLRGFEPGLREWVGAKCAAHTSKEKVNFDEFRAKSPPAENTRIMEKEKTFSAPAIQSSEIVKCWMQVKTELPIAAWNKVFLGK